MAGERASIDFTSTLDTDTTDADQNIDALLTGNKWDTTFSNVITFSFPDSSTDYGYTDSGVSFSSGFDATQREATRDALANFSQVADVVFSELALGSGDGTLRLAEFTGVPTAFGYYPSGTARGGDMAYNTTDFGSPTLGSYAFHTLMHEIGHAMGLKHGHDHNAAPGFGYPDVGPMTPDKDGMEYSVMTYNSFIGQDESPAFYTNKAGHYAQTLMMYDIAALHFMYGANWDTNDGKTTYTFSKSTGEMSINGVGQGTPDANVIFRTVWDGGGKDTYDFSNFTNKLSINLNPGKYSDLDKGGNDQRAMLNEGYNSSGALVGSGFEEYASGHLYNALQHEGDTRSLIENAIGGSKADTIKGNAADNKLVGKGGSDKLYGGSGKDDLRGDNGKDKLEGGNGKDKLEGGSGNDKLQGQKGDDTLKGQKGADRIEGQNGDDKLFGGKGADVFVYKGDGNVGKDTIKDFENGKDMIEISGSTKFNDLNITNKNGDKHISWDGNKIILEGVTGNINSNDFDFV